MGCVSKFKSQQNSSATLQKQIQCQQYSRQINYWKRRIQKLAFSEPLLTITDIGQLFRFLYLNEVAFFLFQEIKQQIYFRLKEKQSNLTTSHFLDQFIKVNYLDDSRFAQFIYDIYFSEQTSKLSSSPYLKKIKMPLQDRLSIFKKQFQYFLKIDLRNSMHSLEDKQKNMQNVSIQLAQILTGSQEAKPEIIKWLKSKVNINHFRQFFLEQAQKQDQSFLYAELWNDMANQASQKRNLERKHFQERQVYLVDYMWCDNLIQYLESKYRVCGSHERLKLKPESVQVSKINPLVSNYYARISSIKVEEKHKGSGYSFNSYPGELNNVNLCGNFEWELARNLRRYQDFVCLSQSTYKSLILTFGGGPSFKRRIHESGLQLRPYFVVFYNFSVLGTNSYQVSYWKYLTISANAFCGDLFKKMSDERLIYQKNMGGEWIQFSCVENKQKKPLQIFSETSFAVYVRRQDKESFKHYMAKNGSRIPIIGEVYESETFNIHKDLFGKTQICLLDVSIIKQPTLISFVILNQGYHQKLTIGLEEFWENFTKANLQRSATKEREGLTNFGKSSYINATLQSLLSALTEDEISDLKGQLGIELREVYKTIAKRKRKLKPLELKTVFDKYCNLYGYQQQYDSHQFFLHFLEQLEPSNKYLIERNFTVEFFIETNCGKCHQNIHKSDKSYSIAFKLEGSSHKQIPIDYIKGNKEMKSIRMAVDMESTMGQWRDKVKKYIGADSIYVCQIENSRIARILNQIDAPNYIKLKQLQFHKNGFLTVFQIKQYMGQQILQTSSKILFKTLKDRNGMSSIVKIDLREYEKILMNAEKDIYENQMVQEKCYKNKIKVYLKSDFKYVLQQRFVEISQFYPFPEDFPSQVGYFQIINYDLSYNQVIGKPFIIKIKNTYPIISLRKALQQIVFDYGFILRLSKIGHSHECCFCGKSLCKSCFLDLQTEYPLCWIQGRLDIVACWGNAVIYNAVIKKAQFSSINQNQENIQQNYSQFSERIAKFLSDQTIQEKCHSCNQNSKMTKSMRMQHFPQILVLHLVRFDFKDRSLNKNLSKWILEEVIVVDRKRYALKSVICHKGQFHGGHYFAISDGFCYKDDIVRKLDYKDVDMTQIYALFYRKLND